MTIKKSRLGKIALILIISLLFQPIALAQSNPAPGNGSNPNGTKTASKGDLILMTVAITAVVGAGVGLVSYVGRQVFTKNSSWSWQGASLGVVGGTGGAIGGAAVGGLLGYGLGMLSNKNDPLWVGLLTMGLGAIGGLIGGISGSTWAGKKGDEIAKKKKAKKGGLNGALGTLGSN